MGRRTYRYRDNRWDKGVRKERETCYSRSAGKLCVTIDDWRAYVEPVCVYVCRGMRKSGWYGDVYALILLSKKA